MDLSTYGAEWRYRFTADEIDHLERVEQGLALISDISRADVTLLVRDGDVALVVAQAQPHSIATLYREPWVGRPLSFQENPLISSGLMQGRRGQRQRNLLDQGTPIIQQVLPVISSSGRTIAVLQIETNLIAYERHKRRHRSFRKAVTWLQTMVLRGDLEGAEQLSRFGEWDGILFVDQTYHIRYLSGIANNHYRRLGYLDDLHDKHIGDLQTRDEMLVRDAFKTGICQEHEVVEGDRHWTRKVVPIRSYGPGWWPRNRISTGNSVPTLRGAIIMVHDDTEARRRELELQILATMIKEVHHRVKNNLQTVASILRMQGRRTDNRETRQQLNEAVNRVLAVAIIHEFLSGDDKQAINIRDVCQRIVKQTQRAAVSPDKNIDLNVIGPVIYLPSQQATACALAANELVLNALEHAFVDKESGSVLVRLVDAGDQVTLEISDDGGGLPETFDPQTTSGLGLMIVRALVESDLKGCFSMEQTSGGTKALVTFQKDNL
ncbi:MAG: histidine kinase N-terminal domain-containing protein [Chloroflexota bacterium]|nr:histidine kinase N-terminal domain-containing protein [Chloroflexota bacterium]